MQHYSTYIIYVTLAFIKTLANRRGRSAASNAVGPCQAASFHKAECHSLIAGSGGGTVP